MGIWRHCSSCRADIDFEQIYWECSVSTCARVARTGLFFCSVACWEAHLPTMRHREAWAVEKKSPSQAAWQRQLAEAERAERPATPRAHTPNPVPPSPAPPSPAARAVTARPVEARKVIAPPPVASSDEEGVDDDILVVVSKLKKYIRARSGMNTSDNVVSVLSDHLRRVCDLAVRKAAEEGRKTVLDRDFRAIL